MCKGPILCDVSEEGCQTQQWKSTFCIQESRLFYILRASAWSKALQLNFNVLCNMPNILCSSANLQFVLLHVNEANSKCILEGDTVTVINKTRLQIDLFRHIIY